MHMWTCERRCGVEQGSNLPQEAKGTSLDSSAQLTVKEIGSFSGLPRAVAHRGSSLPNPVLPLSDSGPYQAALSLKAT